MHIYLNVYMYICVCVCQCIYIYIYIYIYKYMYVSSSCAISTDISDPFSPPLPIVHRFRQVLRATPRILTKQLYVGSSCSPCFCSVM